MKNTFYVLLVKIYFVLKLPKIYLITNPIYLVLSSNLILHFCVQIFKLS